MTPEQYCQAKAAQSGSSFYYSFLFLPAERRRAITALYAFCREVDDVVDEIKDRDVARTKLAWWSHEISELFHGSPQHPVTRAVEREAGQPIEVVRLERLAERWVRRSHERQSANCVRPQGADQREVPGI